MLVNRKVIPKILLEVAEEEHKKFEAAAIDTEERIKIDYALRVLKAVANKFSRTDLLKQHEWIAIVSATHGLDTAAAKEIREA